MNTYTCHTCGNTFIKKYYRENVTKRYHCSRKCQIADKIFCYERCNKTRTVGCRHCIICGELFYNSHITQIVCSMKCRDVKKRNDLIVKIESKIGSSIPDFIINEMNNSISQKQIAKNMGIEYRTLMKFMREHNIKSFTRHEAIRLQWTNNQERKTKASARIKNWMTANPDQSRSNGLKANIKLQSMKGPTSIERAMMDALNSSDITYQFQYIVNDKFACDFKIMNTNIIIECDGNYWHGKESQKIKDRSKNRYLETCGYRVLRFSETQIKTNMHDCIQLILEVMRQPTTQSGDSNSMCSG